MKKDNEYKNILDNLIRSTDYGRIRWVKSLSYNINYNTYITTIKITNNKKIEFTLVRYNFGKKDKEFETMNSFNIWLETVVINENVHRKTDTLYLQNYEELFELFCVVHYKENLDQEKFIRSLNDEYENITWKYKKWSRIPSYECVILSKENIRLLIKVTIYGVSIVLDGIRTLKVINLKIFEKVKKCYQDKSNNTYYIPDYDNLLDIPLEKEDVVSVDFKSSINSISDKKGIIRYKDSHKIGIEFYENINGHDGNGLFYGKFGHCWVFNGSSKLMIKKV